MRHKLRASLLLLLVAAVADAAAGEHVRDLEVSEGAPVGTRIGFIGDGGDSAPPYLIVPVTGSAVDTDLQVDHATGEIRTRVPLDRETRASYSLVAIPLSGDNVRVLVRVLDENDNAPTFPVAGMLVEFPENAPRDAKRTLLPARDPDLGAYNTQRYEIVSGNDGDAFRLSPHMERDGVLYVDLQVKGALDRETRAAYSLVVEAQDGGQPPLVGRMTVNVTVQDVNDNQPVFNQSRYEARVPENATVGTVVTAVSAADADAGDNGRVRYQINRRQSDRDAMFSIDPATGTIAVNRPLDFETAELHELVVVARDLGAQPLETTAFVSISVTDVNDNRPTISVIFLSDDATPKISESAQPGEFVARISVHDPDSKAEYSNVSMNVTLEGGGGRFGLTTRDSIIYLVVVALPLDREQQPAYTLSVVATDAGTPPLRASRTFDLRVTDVNDNAPRFERAEYAADVPEAADPGTSVARVSASDPDEGDNSFVTYSLLASARSSWFHVDARSGLVTTRQRLDCETDPAPRLTLLATDSGFPPLSSTAQLVVTIRDVNDNEPIFDQSFYNVSVAENEPVGRCILKVSATDPDCGVNAMVNYTLGDSYSSVREFHVQPDSGRVCVAAPLDYETRNSYEFPIVATDRGGLSTTAMVKIQLTDVNDNRPVFYPREYNVSLREGGAHSATTPIVVVAASDADSSRFGAVSYRIVAGNDAGLFRIDEATGELFISRPGSLSTRAQPHHHLNVSATDGGGRRAASDAEVFVSVIGAAQRPPLFDRSRYSFGVNEDAPSGTAVGAVAADAAGPVRYSICSGDPDGYFSIDAATGVVRTARALDREARASLLLNVQATSGDPPAYGHAQVRVDVSDVNDNAPEFEAPTVRLSVPENAEPGAPLYSVHARDPDAQMNGVVRYRLAAGGGSLFAVDARLGHLTLTRPLDYETSQRHTLTVAASDQGRPPRSANLTLIIDVQDVNDNPPTFELSSYVVVVPESLPLNGQVVQVTAVDRDTGNNARITYRLVGRNGSDTSGDIDEPFGVFPNSGWLYLKGALDREVRDRYELTVVATDNGTPSRTATARISATVLDSNDNDPRFEQDSYEFSVEENQRSGTSIGSVHALDTDIGNNALISYSLVPANTSFHVNSLTGEIRTTEILDREVRAAYELVVEARDRGEPARTARVQVRVSITDVNDNAPQIVDPQEDVVSVREEQPPGTEVVRIRAIDADAGRNATVTYSLLKGRDSDGSTAFSIDPTTGTVRTKLVLDHEERHMYRLAIAATDGGQPPRQTVRTLRVEVLDLNDNRPTFTSSSLLFEVREDARIGHVVGSVAAPGGASGGEVGHHHVAYTLSPSTVGAFDVDRSSGSLVVAGRLDRETRSEYRLEVRALDTTAINNPQSSAVSVLVRVVDVNDNAPRWPRDPFELHVSEDAPIGTALHNLTAIDDDDGPAGEVRYALVRQTPTDGAFSIDPLTGTLSLVASLDREKIPEHTLVVRASDQPADPADRLESTVTVRVVVDDENDNAPSFVLPAAVDVALDSAITPGMLVTRVLAVDPDSGDNGRVTYIIAAGDDDGTFSLGYDTGVLTLAKPLAAGRSYSLNITASDRGKPARSAITTLRLTSTTSSKAGAAAATAARNSFLDTTYKARIPEDAPPGTFIVKLTPGGDGNYSFSIPSGVAGDSFIVDSVTGVVATAKAVDRETADRHFVPVCVDDGVATRVVVVTVLVTDINDHTPQFASGACYPLSLPENGEAAVVHTVVARDEDAAANGEVTYSIDAGNVGNRFSLDSTTGKLTARSLDRETRARYTLTISAQDRGRPPLRATCNITVRVEDRNDNDPRFDAARYSASLPEDAPADSSVLRVRAVDADLATNARIIYSLDNETHWLFRIDNRTGVVTTAGPLDREHTSAYEFTVVARDEGRHESRSARVTLRVNVTDVNDNAPVFGEYPFRAAVAAFVQPGQPLLRVRADDADAGPNGEVVYSLAAGPGSGRFRIDPTTGVLSARESLAGDNGRLLHVHVVATDRGNPPLEARGLVELQVGEPRSGAARLRFQNDTYTVELMEGAAATTEVARVSAVRSDGRRQRVTYWIGRGGADDDSSAFSVDQDSGVVRVHDGATLDYESRRERRFVVVAEARPDGGAEPLYGYCELIVRLLDRNDNAPHFTQPQYTATVREGGVKGELVVRVAAPDADAGRNARTLYHIVDGNHDNAFVIEPAFSGLIRTNIVLDREIRDSYRLTVIATDEGVPQLTGTAAVSVRVLDANDNRPTFPPRSSVAVPEDAAPGTVLATLAANDVDTHPELTYALETDADKPPFAVDRFGGKLILTGSLDYETTREYTLRMSASDGRHVATTVLTVRVTDVNDNSPIFDRPVYDTTLPDGPTGAITEVLRVNATDVDAGDNAVVSYSLLRPVPGFSIDERSGAVLVNRSALSPGKSRDALLVVVATDGGRPPRRSVTTVRVRVRDSGPSTLGLSAKDYRVRVSESTPRGSIVFDLTTAEPIAADVSFRIAGGDDDGEFEVINPGGVVVLVRPLDRERRASYALRLLPAGRNSAATALYVTVEDANDNIPRFERSIYEASVSEAARVDTFVVRVLATDADAPGSAASDVTYDISSGNDERLFALDSHTGALDVAAPLDADDGRSSRALVVRACDAAPVALCSLTTVVVTIQDENDNAPQFPVSEYVESVAENEPSGTAVFTAHATDLDDGEYGRLNYSLTSIDADGDSPRLFRVDQRSGLVTTAGVFDYERRNRYSLMLRATDAGGRQASVRVRVDIDGRDEFHPQFTERTYRWAVPGGRLPAGFVVGRVAATDRDKGPDGRVVYQLSTQHPYFKMNRTTGAVVVRRKIDGVAALLDAGRDLSLVVTASSGRPGSLTNMTVVELVLDGATSVDSNEASPGGGGTSATVSAAAAEGGLADWALGLLIGVLLLVGAFTAAFLFVHVRNRRNKSAGKSAAAAGTSGGEPSSGQPSAPGYVDASAFDTIPIRGGSAGGGQFAPPKYDEIPPYAHAHAHAASSNSGAATTSELSGSEQSGSSGRGSAEDGDDGDDEEIRMINEGPLQRDPAAAAHDDDNLSDVSVHNTQEYLARLGIVDSAGSSGGGGVAAASVRAGALRIFDEDVPGGGGEPDLTNLIYAKLNDVAGSERGSAADDSGTTVDRVMAMGFGDVGVGHQPSMNGSLSSIVHSEEELTGSYNWDYLLDWGPQYQPLAHVFSEIARLKDDAASVHSGHSQSSSVKSKPGAPPPQTLPPPLLTAVAPRSLALPTRAAAVSSGAAPLHPLLPRSPIGHDASAASFSTSTAMSPSFSPSLSPLATKSPSVSPLVAPHPGIPTAHHVVSLPRQPPSAHQRAKAVVDAELRI